KQKHSDRSKRYDEVFSTLLMRFNAETAASLINSSTNYLFSQHLLPQRVRHVWVLQTNPTALTYVLAIDAVCLPGELNDSSPTSQDFNDGTSQYKYAYPIRAKYEIKKPLSADTISSFNVDTQNSWHH
ncbi:hypothetical protein BC829DRAFT_345229, partial [Chytridium lagenaria]